MNAPDKRLASLIEGMRRAPLLTRSKFRMTDMNGNTVMELFEPDYRASKDRWSQYDPMTGSYHSEAERAGE